MLLVAVRRGQEAAVALQGPCRGAARERAATAARRHHDPEVAAAPQQERPGGSRGGKRQPIGERKERGSGLLHQSASTRETRANPVVRSGSRGPLLAGGCSPLSAAILSGLGCCFVG